MQDFLQFLFKVIISPIFSEQVLNISKTGNNTNINISLTRDIQGILRGRGGGGGGGGGGDTTLPSAVCGNGQIEFGEECDDGNGIDGDYCSGSCRNEILGITINSIK